MTQRRTPLSAIWKFAWRPWLPVALRLPIWMLVAGWLISQLTLSNVEAPTMRRILWLGAGLLVVACALLARISLRRVSRPLDRSLAVALVVAGVVGLVRLGARL